MATKQSTADYLVAQIPGAGTIYARKMFGEYGVYCDEKIVALICDDELFIKPSAVSNQFLDDSHLAPPYPGAKDYYQVPRDKWEDTVWLGAFVHETATALPAPKPKRSKKK